MPIMTMRGCNKFQDSNSDKVRCRDLALHKKVTKVDKFLCLILTQNFDVSEIANFVNIYRIELRF